MDKNSFWHKKIQIVEGVIQRENHKPDGMLQRNGVASDETSNIIVFEGLKFIPLTPVLN